MFDLSILDLRLGGPKKMKWRGSNSERADMWLERADLRHDRADWGAEGVILRLERVEFRPKRGG